VKAYKDLSGQSGVTHYFWGKDYLAVKFKGKAQVYVYTEDNCGKKHIAHMKKLATSGKGLSTYISQHPQVRDNYEVR
jgi:hypothetical protein